MPAMLSLLPLLLLVLVSLFAPFASSQAFSRHGPFQLRLHYEADYNWQQENLVFGTSYCWSCSGSGADIGSSNIQATKLLEQDNDVDKTSAKKQCNKGDTVWIAPCSSSDPKQLFQYEQLDTLLQVDGHTSTLGLFKIAGTDLCLTDDRAENCGFDTTDVDYAEEKCYTLQKCATARGTEDGNQVNVYDDDDDGFPIDATILASNTNSHLRPATTDNLPSIASKQLFVGFNPTAPVFELHPYSLTGYTATHGISYRKCVSNHHHPKPRELIYAQGCDVARRTDSSLWKYWGETCTPYAKCGLCESECNTHEDCQGELECFYREYDEFVPGCGDSLNGGLKRGQNYCYYPGEGMKLTEVGNALGSSSLYECESDCDFHSDCVGDLKCFFRHSYDRVPGCSGQGIKGQDYCYHPLRDELDGGGNEAPRITRSPTQQPTTPKPTPHPTLRKRPDEPERPREYALHDDEHTGSAVSMTNRAHMNPFVGNNDEDGERGEGLETDGGELAPDPPQLATFELVRNFLCYIRQCDLCQGSCVNDNDCAGELLCCRSDEFGEDAIQGLGCAGKTQQGANYCYHTRPYAELEIVPDSGANCGPGQCMACQGDCDDDEECAGNLKCFQRQSYERVPGCNGRGVEGRDYCYKAPDTDDEGANKGLDEVDEEDIVDIAQAGEEQLDPLIDEVEAIDDGLAHEKMPKLTDDHYYCQKVPCSVCEGDCNDSTQCSGDLVCIHREADESIPGCSGKGVRGWDYCVDQLLVDRRSARYDADTEKWWALP